MLDCDKLKRLAAMTGNRVGLVYSGAHDDWTTSLIHADGTTSVHTAGGCGESLDRAGREVIRHLMEDVPAVRGPGATPFGGYSRAR
jgi:hypothetical protein